MINTKSDLNEAEELNTKLPQEKKSKESLRESLHSRHEELHKTDENDLRK